MSFTEKIRDFIAPAEEENELELTEEEATVLSTYEKPKDATVSKINSSANIVLFEPRNFDEAEEIGRHRAKVYSNHEDHSQSISETDPCCGADADRLRQQGSACQYGKSCFLSSLPAGLCTSRSSHAG